MRSLFFMGLLQTELDEAKKLLNNHHIRKSRHAVSPAGPEIIFYAPHLFNGVDCSYSVIQNDLDLAADFCERPNVFGCSPEFLQLASLIIYSKTAYRIQLRQRKRVSFE